jgi:hypothetical protein
MRPRVKAAIRTFFYIFLFFFPFGVAMCLPTEGFPTVAHFIELPGPEGLLHSCFLEAFIVSLAGGFLGVFYELYGRE